MINKATISVVVPVYNTKRIYLSRMLNSLSRQTDKNFETVIVDDKSTDDTSDILDQFLKNNTKMNIKVIHNSRNEQLFQTRKTGVKNSSGAYIIFLDHDDEIKKNTIEILRGAIHKHPFADLFHYGVEVFRPDGAKNENHSLIFAPKCDHLVGSDIIKQLFPIGQGGSGSLWNKMYRRDLLWKIMEPIHKRYFFTDDQLIVFLYAYFAQEYIGIEDRLYIYYFGIGTDGVVGDLAYFHKNRLATIAPLKGLEEQLIHWNADGWVWPYYKDEVRECYAWSIVAAMSLKKNDQYLALKEWTERTNIVDNILGIINTAPHLLSDYMKFLEKYNNAIIDVKVCKAVLDQIDIRSYGNGYDSGEIARLRAENNHLLNELSSHMSIKRSVKLTMGNIKRRLIYGKNR